MLRHVPAQARPEPVCFSLENLCENPAAAEANLQTISLSHFPHECLCRLRFQASFMSHDAAPTDRTAGKGLEPAHFLGTNSLCP
jgi:hypothetical protein